MELIFKNRDKDIITCCYESPEEEDGHEGSELRPFGLLLHMQSVGG
jgi:hypothetical protein